MATKKNDGETTTTTTKTTVEETTETQNVEADAPAQATDDKGIRRGLGAPPPGTTGDPTVKPIKPGETG